MDFLCMDFINSQWYKTHKTFTDPLKDENWFKNFYLKWNLSFTNIPDKEMIDRLLELRDFLSCITDNLYAKKTIASKDINKLNEYLKAFSFYKVLKKEQNKFYLKTIPLKSDLHLIIFEIISSFIDMITKYDIERIKLCENPDCKWIFYDESKSHTRKWCDNTCATLIKVRRFRENKKHGQIKK
ncbi:CGNR zinc finger domain-containing protein [Clostridium sp. PL3]|uniref:CGNR zinc finger domain-containing protein n=1 Tax=Clostridium thailandense TaxID=2794346 RepID=A0A949WUQ9_9CLOT|nr:CGNR zinc finger domain-containing protein [Clostridium thailandense]MBV7272842.1 CGNR zinc finger domain-containing protein [Clostridium thailandense]